MSNQIKEMFQKHLDIKITSDIANRIVKFVNVYETRDQHPEAFNTPYLGLHKCTFSTNDRDEFFNIFGTNVKSLTEASDVLFKKSSFTADIKSIIGLIKRDISRSLRGLSASDMRKIISDIDSVNENFKVASDPLNLLISYLLFLVSNSNITNSLKEQVSFKLVMILQYKFFTSLVNHRFPYKPNEASMVAMFENLTNKSDIKQFGTWKKVMEHRARQFLDKRSIHYPTITKYDNDQKILYFITDVQTRVRNQINLVTSEFVKAKDNQDRISSYSTIGSDTEGNKSLNAVTDGLDMIIASVYNDTLSVTRILDDKALLITSGLFNNVPIQKLRAMLISFSELAVKYHKSGESMKTTKDKDVEILVGGQVLIHSLIQKTYRYCTQNKVEMDKPANIIKAVKDVYGSSRIMDDNITQIRMSVDKVVLLIQDSRRDATLSALRIAFIVYIILLTFKYRK